MIYPKTLPQIIVAIGGVRTAAFGLVDTNKVVPFLGCAVRSRRATASQSMPHRRGAT
jgi:hypothetical protein